LNTFSKINDDYLTKVKSDNVGDAGQNTITVRYKNTDTMQALDFVFAKY